MPTVLDLYISLDDPEFMVSRSRLGEEIRGEFDRSTSIRSEDLKKTSIYGKEYKANIEGPGR